MEANVKVEKKESAIETKALEPVQPHEKQSWWAIAFIWIGVMICVPMLMVGAIMGANFSIGESILICAIGFAVCCLLMTLTGMMGSDQSVPTAVLATKSFGDTGARVIVSLIIMLVQTLWYAVQTATCGAAFSTLMAQLGVNFPVWLSCIIWGAVMGTTAIYGIKLLKILNYIAVPTLLIVCVWGMIQAISTSVVDLGTHNPQGGMPFMSAVSMMIGLFAMGCVISSDYTRYAKSRADTAKSSFLGVLPAAILMVAVGAVMSLAANEPSGDITVVFASMGPGFAIVGMLTLILATWTTNTGNAYTAGIATMKLFNIKDEKRPLVTAICAVVGTVLGAIIVGSLIGIFSQVTSVIAGIVPPIAGVLIADYWIINGGKKERFRTIPGANWKGICAWLVAAIVGVLYALGTIAPIINAALDVIIISTVLYVIFALIWKDKPAEA